MKKGKSRLAESLGDSPNAFGDSLKCSTDRLVVQRSLLREEGFLARRKLWRLAKGFLRAKVSRQKDQKFLITLKAKLDRLGRNGSSTW